VWNNTGQIRFYSFIHLVVLILDLEILSDRMLRIRESVSPVVILPLIPTSTVCLLGTCVMCKSFPVATAVINNHLSCFEVSGLCSCFCRLCVIDSCVCGFHMYCRSSSECSVQLMFLYITGYCLWHSVSQSPCTDILRMCNIGTVREGVVSLCSVISCYLSGRNYEGQYEPWPAKWSFQPL
jgi:hypothetical protein